MTNRFFQLRDDLAVHGRWHLGEIRTAAGIEPTLDNGRRFEDNQALSAVVAKAGLVLDFSLPSFGVPVASSRLASAIDLVSGPDVQAIQLAIAGQSGMVALNALRVVRCLDETRSEFIKWTTHDHRSDLAGRYRQVTKLTITPGSVPPDVHFFRIDGWEVALIVSDVMREAMERLGCFGARFLDLPSMGRG